MKYFIPNIFQHENFPIYGIQYSIVLMTGSCAFIRAAAEHVIYKAIWMAAIGEVLDCRREPNNPEDRYAIAVIRDNYRTFSTESISLFAKEIVAEGIDVEPLGSGSPSLALRNFLRDILAFQSIAINTRTHVESTDYPNFHCSIYSYIIIFRLIKNFMFFIFVIIFTYEIKSTTKFS